MEKIDARGLSCPEPVLLVKKAAQSSSAIEVLVDNRTSAGNITRFAKNSGFAVTQEDKSGDFLLKLKK